MEKTYSRNHVLSLVQGFTYLLSNHLYKNPQKVNIFPHEETDAGVNKHISWGQMTDKCWSWSSSSGLNSKLLFFSKWHYGLTHNWKWRKGPNLYMWKNSEKVTFQIKVTVLITDTRRTVTNLCGWCNFIPSKGKCT